MQLISTEAGLYFLLCIAQPTGAITAGYVSMNVAPKYYAITLFDKLCVRSVF